MSAGSRQGAKAPIQEAGGEEDREMPSNLFLSNLLNKLLIGY
jgi:hypothetical protein